MEKIYFLERLFIHLPDIPEWILKKYRGNADSLRFIYDKHEKEYSGVLRKMRQHNGRFPHSLRLKIINDESKLCTKIRFYTAVMRRRINPEYFTQKQEVPADS